MIDVPQNLFDRPGEDDLTRRILDSVTAEIAVLNQNGTIIYVNDAWTRFATLNGGSPSTTGVGVNYLDVCRRANNDDALLAEKACRGIEDVLAGSRETFKLEYPCHSPQEQRWFLLYVSRLRGEQHSVVTTHLSITERKLTEQRLVMAERLAAIGQAMQGLSHEGRKALQRARASIDLLRMQVGHDHDALGLIERIERAQDHLLGAYEEVKSYAAPISLRREPCRLNKIVDEVWSDFESRSLPVRFSHLQDAGNLTCDVDVSGIRLVLQLVIENAVTAATESPEISVTYRKDVLDGSPAITTIVSDNGPGVPPASREKVFEPFYTTRPNGTGLGLAVCRRIISAHGGQIGFEAPQREGASVYITLPVERPTNR